MASVAVAGRADLTDAQWARLEPLLPCWKKAGRPPRWTKRQLIDGIWWRCRVGAPWRTCRASTGPGKQCMDCSGGGSGPGSGQRS
ncbi:transposase [Nocardia sp. NPDC004573]